jgi:hypothetical protein
LLANWLSTLRKENLHAAPRIADDAGSFGTSRRGRKKPSARPANVVNLMDALRRSVEGSGGKGKTPKAPAKMAEAAVRPKRRSKA